MFDVTADDIQRLSDVQLRELVGRLCEAELTARGHPAVAATWGGSQTASDGGLDVRVSLPVGTAIDGFIRRASTGVQVKKPDMPRGAIMDEMRPAGSVRQSILDLVAAQGAYVIVSSTGSTADTPLQARVQAMRDAVADVPGSEHLCVDFYDRTRLATAVRQHAGLIIWVRNAVGRSLVGWYPFGPWSNPAEGLAAEYLLDEKLKVRMGRRQQGGDESIEKALDGVRDLLNKPRSVLRLVGLSGVGKTRFLQALFDRRIGVHALDPSLAVYTNLNDNPDPQPVGLASDLVAGGMRAVLVVDNCPSDLHRRLAELCASGDSALSVITVEYDIRDDQPEGTEVISLETSSPSLIETLVARRYAHLSAVDVRTIAAFSGGNARIAIALAETVDQSESVSQLSDDELFQRLFKQRHDPNDSLLVAAQACALVYSFQAELQSGDMAELPRLAALAGQTTSELYRHVAQLLRRDLVQARGEWKAVLPHAIANKLAGLALDDFPLGQIEEQLASSGNRRLAKSFARRLSYLHLHPRATSIARSWLSEGGRLCDPTSFTEDEKSMFDSVAVVLPDAALGALERASRSTNARLVRWRDHLPLLRLLAFEAPQFERTISVLVDALLHSKDRDHKEVSDTLASLFPLYLSGTHANIQQRIEASKALLLHSDASVRAAGLSALDSLLEATHFNSAQPFEFGGRSRDFGYEPTDAEQIHAWYRSVLSHVGQLIEAENVPRDEIEAIIARRFRGLWTSAGMFDELESLMQKLTAHRFWRDGWTSCRQTLRFDQKRLSPEGKTRLAKLEAQLRPTDSYQRVQAFVLGRSSSGLDIADVGDESPSYSYEALESLARGLGAEAAEDRSLFDRLLPSLILGGVRAWTYGYGLAEASTDPQDHWSAVVETYAGADPNSRDVSVLGGMLAALSKKDVALTQTLLDRAANHSALVEALPLFQCAAGLDEQGVTRLTGAMDSGKVNASMFANLSIGRATQHLSGPALKELLLHLADCPDGVDVAIDILHMHFHAERTDGRPHAKEALEAGRQLLERLVFTKEGDRFDHARAQVASRALVGPEGAATAIVVAESLKAAVASYQTYSFNHQDFVQVLLEAQPLAVLSAIFPAAEEVDHPFIEFFEGLAPHRGQAMDVVTPEVLLQWCNERPARRFQIAAAIVTFRAGADAEGKPRWSEQAKALLRSAPDVKVVLREFIDRFPPRSWSGSRAALTEANGQLLNQLESLIPSELIAFVVDEKARLREVVRQERIRETERDRVQDERFE